MKLVLSIIVILIMAGGIYMVYKNKPNQTERSFGNDSLDATATNTTNDQGELKIVDTSPGDEPAAKAGDSLTVNYTGKLTNGTVFDTSVGRTPFEFTLGQGMVIEGWDKGLVGMKKGGKRSLTIPASLGYGSQAMPGIPANSTLIFDVELLDIK